MYIKKGGNNKITVDTGNINWLRSEKNNSEIEVELTGFDILGGVKRNNKASRGRTDEELEDTQ